MDEQGKIKLESLVFAFTTELRRMLVGKISPGPLTYGFEYELMPTRRLTPKGIDKIAQYLPRLGYRPQKEGDFLALNGLHLTFEPGGQLEYGSPPLFAFDDEALGAMLEQIQETNRCIEEFCGVKYRGIAYLPGRETAKLCLGSRRYLDMHALFSDNGGRGREMMKGTASIHFHVRIRCLAEMLSLYRLLAELAADADFGMGPERRKIWDATEKSRCGLPPFDLCTNENELLAVIVGHALQALDLRYRRPFFTIKNITFADFLLHLTTIFTDVRLNLKGPTLELRTPDSLPPERFPALWRRFVMVVERKLNEKK
ncbi:MAG: hypothetical protein JXR89_10585 [Deltaproteobacteria bacterium]|nr:hypothetical protein [Deltaproteobacteria bacterium]